MTYIKNFLKREWRNCLHGIALGFMGTSAVLIAYHTLTTAQPSEQHGRSRPLVEERDMNQDGLRDLVLRYDDGHEEILLREREGRLVDARLVGYCLGYPSE